MIFTSVVFPNYYNDLNVAYTQMMQGQGLSEEEITKAIDAMKVTQTPFMGAIMGVVGTVGTALVASLVIAIFKRKK